MRLVVDCKMKVVLIPGMGCTPVAESNWYAWFAKEMESRPSVECVLRDFPDPHKCRDTIWLPFAKSLIDDPADTIVVGHSSGAACAMRMLEQKPGLKACILVAAAHTDLGDDGERESGYFNRPWDWEAIKQGADNIVIFHGTDDNLIPVKEARYIAQQLGSSAEYQEMARKSHFWKPWPELLSVVDKLRH